jgi:P27 family predicted phage terminase small subunit
VGAEDIPHVIELFSKTFLQWRQEVFPTAAKNQVFRGKAPKEKIGREAAALPTEKTIRRKRNKIVREVRKNLEAKGLYSVEYEPAIARYADMQMEYDHLTELYISEDYPFETETQTGTKKAPIVTTLESLRQMMLAYENALGLTPRADKRLTEERQTKAAGGFNAILNKLDGMDFD